MHKLVDNKHANWGQNGHGTHPMRQGMGLADLADLLALAGHQGQSGVGAIDGGSSSCVGAFVQRGKDCIHH